MKKSIGALVLIIAGGTLAACNGNSINGSPPPGTGTNCGGPPSANQVEVLYPKPGSKNAPPSLSTIFISTKGQLPPNNQYNLALAVSSGSPFGNLLGTSIFFGTSKSKVPTPHANPTYPNPTYYATSLGPSVIIGPHISVSVLWSIANNCTPRFQISSFKTGA
jgi:hypothetical protein